MQMGFGPGWSRLCTYLLCMTLKKKKKSSHSPGLTRHSHVASAVQSVDCPLPLSLAGSLTGHCGNEMLHPRRKSCLSPIYTVWFGIIKYILNEHGVSVCSGSLLLIGCY